LTVVAALADALTPLGRTRPRTDIDALLRATYPLGLGHGELHRRRQVRAGVRGHERQEF
jgi:hypothetical protein